MPLDFSNITVMLVEDNLTIRRLFVDVLDNIGVGKVIQCSDGTAALLELEHHQPDVIFADWRMRPMGGIALLKEIRSGDAPGDPYVPVIMLTSHAQRHRVEAARDAGATEFLVKPCTPRTIYDRIASLVTQPRSFVKSPDFNGPDRRRRSEFRIGPGPSRRRLGDITGSVRFPLVSVCRGDTLRRDGSVGSNERTD